MKRGKNALRNSRSIPPTPNGVFSGTPGQDFWQPGISGLILGNAPLSLKEHLPLFAAQGFTAFEPCFYINGHFKWRDSAEIRLLRAACRVAGLSIYSAHAPNQADMSGADAASMRAAMSVLRQAARSANALRAREIIAHVGLNTPPSSSQERETAVRRLCDAMAELSAIAKKENVRISLETMPHSETSLSGKTILEMVQKEQADKISCTIDAGHTFTWGELPGFPQKVGNRLAGLHIHDNEGQHDQHLLPGRGLVDWRRFMADLIAAGYAGPLMLEIWPPANETLESAVRLTREAYDRLLETGRAELKSHGACKRLALAASMCRKPAR